MPRPQPNKRRVRKQTRRPEKRTSARVASDAGKLVRLSGRGHFYWSRRPLLIDDGAAKDWKLIDDLVESVSGSALVQKDTSNIARIVFKEFKRDPGWYVYIGGQDDSASDRGKIGPFKASHVAANAALANGLVPLVEKNPKKRARRGRAK